METIKIISRGSKLAQAQVQEIIAHFTAQLFDVKYIESYGDKNKHMPLGNDIAPDFFTRELDAALLAGEADVAIHSAKDLPYPLPDGLQLFALTKAFDKTDVLVSRNHIPLAGLKTGSRIGTSSEQRTRQILEHYPHLQPQSIRGTIEERLALIQKGDIDALIVAGCALKRLGLENIIADTLPFATHPLQGNLAVIGRAEDVHLWRFFAPIDIQRYYGIVTLAGFGPGNPDLLTLKAKYAIDNAEIIFYDDLIDQNYLSQIKADKIYVGKRKGVHSFSQEEINEMLYQAALSGKNTLRLKGGDPFIFGRGSEEFHYLRQRLVYTQVIPGITSASAAAAWAGFALTGRGKAASVALVNGSAEKVQTPNADTLVYYMGATNLQNIGRALLNSGKMPDSPVAIISNAGNPKSLSQYYKLADLAEKEIVPPTPALIFNGSICQNCNLNTFRQRQILYTGINPGDGNYKGVLTHIPFIEIHDYEPAVYLFEIIENIDAFDYIVFTSRYAVKYFMKFIYTSGRDARHLWKNKIVSIGNTTSQSLKHYGILPDLQANEESSHGIIALFAQNRIRGKRVLIPRSDIALSVLPNGLRLEGNRVDVITVYSTQMPKNIPDIDLNAFDAVVFTSPSGLHNFRKRFCHLPEHLEVITRGRETQKAYEELKNELHFVI